MFRRTETIVLLFIVTLFNMSLSSCSTANTSETTVVPQQSSTTATQSIPTVESNDENSEVTTTTTVETDTSAPTFSSPPASQEGGVGVVGGGTVTLNVHSVESGNSYPLEAEVNGNEVERIHFSNGGWTYFTSSEIDSTGNGSGTDIHGREWEFEGFDGGTPSGGIMDESDNDMSEQSELGEEE